MNLNSSTSLKAVLGGAVATTELTIRVSYQDLNLDGQLTKPASLDTSTNGASDVTILSAPPAAVVRTVLSVDAFNSDTAAATLTIKTDDGTQRPVAKFTLGSGDSLCYR